MSEQVQEVPAARNPLARLVGVIVSPGETFQEIAKNPGWLFPYFAYLLVFFAAFSVYSARADWVSIITDQIEKGPFSSFIPEAQRDQIVAQSVKPFRTQSATQITLRVLVGQIFWGQLVIMHFFALLYSSLFVMMGALSDLKLGRAWLNFLLCAASGIFYVVVAWIGNSVFADAPSNTLLLTVLGSIVFGGLWLWLLKRHADSNVPFKQMISAMVHGAAAVAIVGAIVVAAIVLTGPEVIQVPIDGLVKSNLGALVSTDSAVLESLLGSLDLFTIWTLIVLTLGFKAVTRLSTGLAASLTFLPWGIIVLIKLAWAAAAG